MADRKRTLLLIDDDVDFLTQMEIRLRDAGYAVVAAEGEAEGLRLAAENAPDLAVVDLMMEHMDSGFTLAHALKRGRPDLPVIMVTGVTAETGMVFDAESGGGRSWIKADALLAKPVRFEQLLGVIERLLGETA